MSSDVTDERLLGALAGPYGAEARAALAELYRRHACHVRGLLGRFGGLDWAALDDCVQETFLIVMGNAAKFQGGSARPWLLAIAVRRVRDRRRSEARRRQREAVAASEQRRNQVPAARDLGATELLEGLTERHRVVLELRFVQGLSQGEVAGILGVSLRTVQCWSSQAMTALRLRWEATDEVSPKEPGQEPDHMEPTHTEVEA